MIFSRLRDRLNHFCRFCCRGEDLFKCRFSLITKIHTNFNVSTEMIQSIAKSTEDHSSNSKQVTKAIAKIAQTAQHVASSVSDQVRGTEQVLKSSNNMRLNAVRFKKSSTSQNQNTRTISQSFDNIYSLVRDVHKVQNSQDTSSQSIKAISDKLSELSESQMSTGGHVSNNIAGVLKSLSDLKSALQSFHS